MLRNKCCKSVNVHRRENTSRSKKYGEMKLMKIKSKIKSLEKSLLVGLSFFKN